MTQYYMMTMSGPVVLGSDMTPDERLASIVNSLPNDKVTLFTGESLDGNRYFVAETSSRYLKSLPINASVHHSLYVPPGLQAIVYDGPNQQKALTNGDYYSHFIIDGPGWVTRSMLRDKSGGAMYWRWIRVQDFRTPEQRERDAQLQALAREADITQQESGLARQLADEASDTAQALSEASESQAQREALRGQIIATQQAEAAAQARAEELARQQAIAEAEAAYTSQQEAALSQYGLGTKARNRTLLIGGAIAAVALIGIMFLRR